MKDFGFWMFVTIFYTICNIERISAANNTINF